MRQLEIDTEYLQQTLLTLLETPSPSGHTDSIVRGVCQRLDELDIAYELTRRGAIRANLPGERKNPNRAVVAHVDTIGAMIRGLKDNGRLSLVPVGTWSSRFAEGARAIVFSGAGQVRGTILPLKASGHAYNSDVDTQPVSWDQVELRVDLDVRDAAGLAGHGLGIGDWVAIDPAPEITDTGFIVSRHLDDKAGVAAVLAAAKAVKEADGKVSLPVDCHLLFTIFEEVGSGASAILHQDVAEMVGVDNAVAGPGQNSSEYNVSVAFMDSAGPYDFHLSHQLLRLAEEGGLEPRRVVFTYYRSDAATAVEAGNDIRTALLGFGVDASHGYERTHISSLVALAKLLVLYFQSPPVAERDRVELGPLKGFPRGQEG